MNNLSLIGSATTIASNLTTIKSTLDTRTLRKSGNNLVYSLQTISTGRQIMNFMNFQGRDLERGEVLLDAFTVRARDEIMKTR